MGWLGKTLYGILGVSGLVFVYHFHQAEYGLHRTELLLLERFRALPFYRLPEPPRAEANGSLDQQRLPPDLAIAFAEWFIHTDLQEAGGVVRDDILELFKELGLDEEHKSAKDFLHRGDGQLEEHRRLTGAGLQESITLLSKMSLPEDGSPCTVGAEGVQLLRKKLKVPRAPSVADGAQALQQAMSIGSTAGEGALEAAAAQAAAEVSPPAPSFAEPEPAAPTPPTSQPAPAALGFGQADDPVEVDDGALRQFEDARLARVEGELLAKLSRQGSLSPAEESRLQDIRHQRTQL